MNATARPAGLVFDEVTHTYRVDGVVVPSVTQILARTGLTDFSGIPDRIRIAALNRGRRVHQAANYLLEGDLDWATVDDADRGYVESCAAFLAAAEFIVLAAEIRLFHPVLRYAGTADAIGIWHGERAIADWCVGDLAESRKDLQTSAYSGAAKVSPPAEWFEFAADSPIARVGVRLKKDGSLPATEPYRSPRDFALFAAACAVAHEQMRRGRQGVAA